MIDHLDEFVIECAKQLGDDINGILYYGSSSRNERSPFSDQDLLITARDYSPHLMLELHHIIKSVTFLIDLPVVFTSEIPANPDNFRLINHGCYFLEILKLATPLYGGNIFLDLPRPSEAAIRQSLFDTIVEYAQSFRRHFVESNRERSLLANYQLNRRLIKAAYDLSWIIHGQPQNDGPLLSMLNDAMPNWLTDTEQLMMFQLLDVERADILSANLSGNHSQTRLEIMEKIYRAAQHYINPLS